MEDAKLAALHAELQAKQDSRGGRGGLGTGLGSGGFDLRSAILKQHGLLSEQQLSDARPANMPLIRYVPAGWVAPKQSTTHFAVVKREEPTVKRARAEVDDVDACSDKAAKKAAKRARKEQAAAAAAEEEAEERKKKKKEEEEEEVQAAAAVKAARKAEKRAKKEAAAKAHAATAAEAESKAAKRARKEAARGLDAPAEAGSARKASRDGEAAAPSINPFLLALRKQRRTSAAM
jgi:hypothetical protein